MRLSVITVNRNDAEGLKKTVQSVIAQDFNDFEYIIVDGASTDNSVDVIDAVNEHFKNEGRRVFRYVSESDSGIFQAMNKGIRMSCGDYLLFLNSGDFLYESNVLSYFSELNAEEDFVSGDIIIEQNGKLEVRRSPLQVDFLFFFKNSLPHQATFIKRDVFEIYGMYNEKNRIKSDWELSLRSLVAGDASYKHFDHVVSFFDVSGVSSQSKYCSLKRDEQRRVLVSIMPEFAVDALYHYDEKVSSFIPQSILNNEYMSLKNGRLGWAISFLLWVKKVKRTLKMIITGC